MRFEQRAAALFIDFPIPPTPPSGTVHVRHVGKLFIVGGALPFSEGKVQTKGRLGLEVSLDQGRIAARVAVIQSLGMMRSTLQTLDRVRQVLQMTGYIASGPEFFDHGKVLDGASQLLMELFGPAGHHVRTAVGVASLPQNACVSLELVVEVK